MSILSWFKKKTKPAPTPERLSKFMPNEFEFILSDEDKLRQYFKLYDNASDRTRSSLFEYWIFIEECINEKIREFAKSNNYSTLQYILDIKLDSATAVTITAKFLRNDK